MKQIPQISLALLLVSCATKTSNNPARVIDNPVRSAADGQSNVNLPPGSTDMSRAVLDADKAAFETGGESPLAGKTFTKTELLTRQNEIQQQSSAENLFSQNTSFPDDGTELPVAATTSQANLVQSPYSENLVDITGFPSGSIVMCPHSLKKFRVP